MEQKNLAAIDLGTNSCRITITDINGNILFRDAVATKLGEGMYKNMCFTPEAIKRGIDCLKQYAEEMHNYDVGNYRAVATASCRMAANGNEFVRKVKETSGIKLDVIDGKEEAILNLKGALINADKNAEYIVVYDLGGGSTELTLATNAAAPQVLCTISIPWGARNASEAFELGEYNEQNVRRLQAEIRKYVQDFLQKTDYLHISHKSCCVATSSTPLRLVSMVENTGTYSKEYADGRKADTEDISQQIENICKMSVEEMQKNPYIGVNRGPIFVAACIIFKTIYEELQIKELTASLKGAQEAIIQELIGNG